MTADPLANEVFCDRCARLWHADAIRDINGVPVCPDCSALVDGVVSDSESVREVAVFDRVLTPEEIRLRYEEGRKRLGLDGHE